MVMEDLTFGGEHTIQYVNNVSLNCTLEAQIILLTVISINLIKIKFKKERKGK